MKKVILIGIIAGVLGGCAGPGPYGPNQTGGTLT